MLINDLYKTYVSICKQIREDSYNLKHMPHKQLYFFVKLYVKFKGLIPFMQMKQPENKDDDTEIEDIAEILDLPHMKKI